MLYFKAYQAKFREVISNMDCNSTLMNTLITENEAPLRYQKKKWPPELQGFNNQPMGKCYAG